MTQLSRTLLLPGILTGTLGACEGQQRVLDTRSAEAARIADLWWVMLVIAAVVCVLYTIVLGLACFRAVHRQRGNAVREIAGSRMVVLGGVVLPLVVLFPLLAFNYRVGTEVLPPVHWDEDALHIEVIGHKFWWEVRYPGLGIVTANEIRVPAGQRIRVDLMAPDVIHSFWVPQLHGKLDMIPGRRNTLWLLADEPGMFRGQCAEFCGTAHALMAFWLEAMPEEDFGEWVAVRTAPHTPPPSESIALGREVYRQADCHQCHATPDFPLDERVGQPGPDLSDFASRRFIGAGTVENNRGNLAAWIIDPSRLKPGARMPPTPDLEGPRLQALLDYLESLR
jgi:cytochrome c oxidase subunit II